MAYYPNSYILVEVVPKGQDPHYRVFGCWGDYWRLNSGIEEIDRDGRMLLFHGSSGSLYRVEEDHYYVSVYASEWLNSLKKKSEEIGAKVRFLDSQEAKEYIDKMLSLPDEPTSD